MPRSLSASPIVAPGVTGSFWPGSTTYPSSHLYPTSDPLADNWLTATAVSSALGTYPGSAEYPGSDEYPGRGAQLSASGIVAGTGDSLPITVPFTIQPGTALLTASPIT